MDYIAGLQAGQIEIEAVRRPRANRSSRGGLIGQQARHVGGKLVKLGLRLHQRFVAQLEIAGDGAGADRIGLNQVERTAVREMDRECTEVALGRIGVPLGIRCHRALRIERQRRGLGTDQLHARIGEDLDLIVAVVDDANVHQLRQLIDILVALVLQGCGRSIGGVAASKLGVEIDDLLHRRIGGVDRRIEPGFRLAAQRLDAGRHAVELLRQRLRGIEHADPRRLAVRAGR